MTLLGMTLSKQIRLMDCKWSLHFELLFPDEAIQVNQIYDWSPGATLLWNHKERRVNTLKSFTGRNWHGGALTLQ